MLNVPSLALGTATSGTVSPLKSAAPKHTGLKHPLLAHRRKTKPYHLTTVGGALQRTAFGAMLPGFMLIVVMGVAGSGKSTVCAAMAKALSTFPRLHVALFDGDDFHSAANKAKMARGEPLNESDRQGWLAAVVEGLARFIDAPAARRPVALLACSALKRQHRDALRRLRRPCSDVLFVHLQGPAALIGARLQARQALGEHFMPASLLPSQLATLEAPVGEADVITVPLVQKDGTPAPPEALAAAALQAAHLPTVSLHG